MTTDHDDSALPAPRPPARLREQFTRPVPKGAAAQFRFLLGRAKGSTAAVAARLGISRRTVQRYAAGKLKRPQKALQATLADETARDWQPGVRARVREQASSNGGLRITTRAHFGFRAALGSTDDPRPRLITQTVSPEHAGRILAVRERSATDVELQELVAQALGHVPGGDGELAAALSCTTVMHREGQTATTVIPADASAGVYRFYCQTHHGAGEVGKFTLD